MNHSVRSPNPTPLSYPTACQRPKLLPSLVVETRLQYSEVN